MTESSRDTHLDCFNLQRTLVDLRQIQHDTKASLQRVVWISAACHASYEARPCRELKERAEAAARELRELQKKQKYTSKALKRTERRYARKFRKLQSIEVTKVEAALSDKAQRVANAEAASVAKEIELDVARATIAKLQAQMVEKDTQIKRLSAQHQKPQTTNSEGSTASSSRRLDAWKEGCQILFQKLRQAKEQISTLESRLRIAERDEEALDLELDRLDVVVEHIVEHFADGEQLQAVKLVRGYAGAMDCLPEESLEVPIYLDIR